MEEKPECHLKMVQKRDEKGRLMKGTPPGPGRPLGSVGYETMMNEAIKEYAKLNKIPESEIRKKIYMVGIAGALSKDYSFYKDFMDRTHGKPKENVDLTSGGEKIKGNVLKVDLSKLSYEELRELASQKDFAQRAMQNKSGHKGNG